MKPDGTLVHSSGNPATDMTVVTNGELTLASSARKYQSGQTVAPVDNLYTIALDGTEDWSFPYSLALTNAPEGTKVTDLYDVTLSMIAQDVDGSIDYTLTWDDVNGIYHLINTDLELDIDDNTTIMDGKGLQNIQRMRFYATELGVTELNESGSTLGNFRIRITATRKVGGLDPMVLDIAVATDPLVAEPQPE